MKKAIKPRLKVSSKPVSPYEGFTYQKKHTTINTDQTFYKAKKGFDEYRLDNTIKDILKDRKVKGVGLIFKVKDEETEVTSHVSDYITKGLQTRLERKGIPLYDHLSTKLKYSKSVHEYELKNIYIRVIYAKSKDSKSKNRK